MITVYRENGKPFGDDYSIIALGAQESFDPTKAACGGCGVEGFLCFYCKYTRWLDILEGGAPGSVELSLDRYQCSRCGKTHVVAPGELVIPYTRHSLGFIIAVLEAYTKREKPVRQIAEDFQIVVSTLYEWKGRFHGQFELLVGKAGAAPRDTGNQAGTILNMECLAQLLYIFVETFRMCFLQSERSRTARYFTLRGYLVISPGGSPRYRNIQAMPSVLDWQHQKIRRC